MYYKLKVADQGGVASLIAVEFLSTLFIAMLNMQMAVPVLIKSRAVAYRERAARMYCPEAGSVAAALIELPWLALICAVVVPILHFMARPPEQPDDGGWPRSSTDSPRAVLARRFAGWVQP